MNGISSALRSNRTLTVGEIARDSSNPRNLPEGMDLGLVAGGTFACKEQNFPNGNHVCELAIDKETGAVQIKRDLVDDIGTVMNLLLLEGQIRGGIAQRVGQVLMEDPLLPQLGSAADGFVHGSPRH